MTLHELTPRKWRATALASALALLSSTLPMSAETAPAPVKRASTQTPIQHVIVIIGENRTFDQIFATYQPRQGQTIDNLLSEGIVNADGSPGPNFAVAQQNSAVDRIRDFYQISPGGKSLYSVLPTPLVGGPTTPYFTTLQQAMAAENGLADDYYQYMLTGGTGLPGGTPDTRIRNVFNLPPDRSSSPTKPLILTMFTTTARCTASTRCGSNGLQCQQHHQQRSQRLQG